MALAPRQPLLALDDALAQLLAAVTPLQTSEQVATLDNDELEDEYLEPDDALEGAADHAQ